MNIAFSWPRKEWLAAVSIVLIGAGLIFLAPKATYISVCRDVQTFKIQNESQNQIDAHRYWISGWEQFDRKKYQKALDDFKIAYNLEPGSGTYACAVADTKVAMDDFKGAIDVYNEAINLGVRNSGVFNSRGYAYLKAGNIEAAHKDFEQVVNLYPGNPLGYENRGWTNYLLGNHEQAKKDMDKGIAMNPNSPTAYIDRANFKLKLGDKKGADADFKKVLSSKTTAFHRNFVARGLAQLHFENKAEAKSEFEYALVLNPCNTEAKAQLALLK